MMEIDNALEIIKKEVQRINNLINENNELKRYIQDVLDYGHFEHYQKKMLWKAGFNVKFPKTYNWMKEFTKNNKGVYIYCSS